MSNALRRPGVQAALAALAYLAWAIYVTRPMPWNIGTQVFGPGGDDNWSLIAFYREMVEHGLNPFASSVIPDWAAPEGLSLGYAVNLVQWPVVVILYTLTALFGEVAGLNVFVLSSFVLNGTAMFLFARRLTGSTGAAFVAGFAFAFFPRMVVWAQNHQYFAHGWVLILMSWRLLELSDRPTLRNGVLAGLAALFALSWNPYYVLFGAILYAVFVVADLIRLLRRRAPAGPLFRAHLVSASIPFAFFAAVAVVARTASETAGGTVSRGISEAYTYSSRIHEYLLPDARNPVFGPLTDDFIFAHMHGSGYGEMNSYLGISLMLLAGLALVLALRGRFAGSQRRIVWLMLAVAITGLLFSAPPSAQITPSIRLYFPTWVVFEITSTWRGFSRIFPVVGLGVCVLAAFGIAWLLRGRRPAVQAALVAAIVAVVAVDLYVTPYVRTTQLPHPQIYDVLASQPGRGLVAEYPLNPDKIPIYDSRLNQDLHDRRIINGYGENSDQEIRALAISQLGDPRTPGRLALLGVRWIVVDERPPPRPDIIPPGAPGAGFRFIDRREGLSLWEVVAEPARTWVPAGAGFYPREASPPNEFHWMGDEGDLLVHAACGTCTGDVRFRLNTFYTPRTVVIRDQQGRQLEKLRVGPREEYVDVPVTVRGGRSEIHLEATPGPQVVRETIGGFDERALSVQVVNPRFVPD